MEDFKLIATMGKLKEIKLQIDYINNLPISDMAKAAAICELETRKEDLKKQIKEYIDSF